VKVEFLVGAARRDDDETGTAMAWVARRRDGGLDAPFIVRSHRLG
jgi:hypothetical protein